MSHARHYLGLCAIAKDETPNLREWVAYHHAAGFERILIYDNGSAIPVRETLADMCESGIVETLSIEGEHIQLVAYNHCLRNYGHEFVWLAFLDLDEFLLIHHEDDARIFCAGYEEYAGISINWRNFGSSGHLKRPEGLVIESYRECLGEFTSVKCIVKPSAVAMPLSPHHFIFTDGEFAVSPEKVKVDSGHAPPSTALAQINHYTYRSQQDFEAKVARGYAMPHTIDMTGFYAQAEQRGEIRTEILRHAAKTREIMRSGTFGPYIPVDSSLILEEPYPAALARLAAAAEVGDIPLARLLFVCNRRRFAGKLAFCALGERVFGSGKSGKKSLKQNSHKRTK
ncbi:MAG: hypothetical protein DELT_01932 [Desulfovibrio sp.]